jgi:uncharacterized OsmC-like protein
MAENVMKFSVHSTSSKMKTEVETGKHRFVIDEPPDLGGTDEGANPLEPLLGALVGCENVIANFVAKELGFQLNGIRFHAEGEERVQELQKIVDQRCPVFTLISIRFIVPNIL